MMQWTGRDKEIAGELAGYAEEARAADASVLAVPTDLVEHAADYVRRLEEAADARHLNDACSSALLHERAGRRDGGFCG